MDIINTNKRIEQYKKENRDIIMKNRTRLGRDEIELEIVLENEKAEEEQRRIERENIEKEARAKKQKEKEALIDELMFSTEDASKIVDEFAKQAEKTREEAKQLPVIKPQTEFSTGVKFGQQSQFIPVPKVEEGPLFEYEEMKLLFDGPLAPTQAEVETNGYIRHIRYEYLEKFPYSNLILNHCFHVFQTGVACGACRRLQMWIRRSTSATRGTARIVPWKLVWPFGNICILDLSYSKHSLIYIYIYRYNLYNILYIFAGIGK